MEDTGYAKAEVWSIDLSSFSSVIAFAERFEKDGGRLDILVMNAGVATPVYEATADGYESTSVFYCPILVPPLTLGNTTSLQVNHLGTSLLSLLLLPSMVNTANQASTVSRLVIVSSDVHYFTKISKDAQSAPNILAKLNSKEYSTASSAFSFPALFLFLLTK